LFNGSYQPLPLPLLLLLYVSWVVSTIPPDQS
jgi:hypothetical protein